MDVLNLIRKYDKKGPYYTSYPPEAYWSKSFSQDDFSRALTALASQKEPLSLYIHFPFCPMQCFYCFCRSKITRDRDKIREFLDYARREAELYRTIFSPLNYIPRIKEIQFGGGSPSFMTEEEFGRLLDNIGLFTDLSDLEEITLEIDFRTVDTDRLKFYQAKGVNRASFGIQDFDPQVQKAVNRVQTREALEKLLSPDIRRGFRSVNFDLIYGLPRQTRQTFQTTLDIVKDFSPDRICIYNYNHRPDINIHQSYINEADLPPPDEKTVMFLDAVRFLSDTGYELIGIDHFAKPTDDLARAKRARTIGRNFNGYSVGRANHLLGLGPTGSGRFLNYYVQNVHPLDQYYQKVAAGHFPLFQGYALNRDDLIRRDVIDRLICLHRLDFEDIENNYDLDFETYFAEEQTRLDEFIRDQIVQRQDNALVLTPTGRLFVRHLCRVFDRY